MHTIRSIVLTLIISSMAYFSASCAGTRPEEVDDRNVAEQIGSSPIGPYENNPFSPSTVVRFNVADTAQVTLDIYNVNGELVVTMIDSVMAPGRYVREWDGNTSEGVAAPSGVYFCRATVGVESAVKKLVLLR